MKKELISKLEQIYSDCLKLIGSITEEPLKVSGNVAIFSQSEQEHQLLSKFVKTIVKPSQNPNQKYFELNTPIVLNDSAVITHIYIRKHDTTEYGRYLGDIDFVVDPIIYKELKSRVESGEFPNAVMYNRPGWDTIQVSSEEAKAVGYICTQEMAEKVRIKFDNLTNL